MNFKLINSVNFWKSIISTLALLAIGIGGIVVILVEDEPIYMTWTFCILSTCVIAMACWDMVFLKYQSSIVVNTSYIMQKIFKKTLINWKEAKLKKSRYLGSLYVIYGWQKAIFIRPMLFSSEEELWKTLAKHIPPERWETEYPSHYLEVSDEEKLNWPWVNQP